MRFISRYLVALTFALVIQTVNAQEESKENYKENIELLEEQKFNVTQLEKNALKQEVEIINQQLENTEISNVEAQKLKKDAAEKRAMNIENKLTILDNKIALLKRNGVIDLYTDSNQLMNGSGTIENDGDRIFGVKYNSGSQNKIVYDKRTSSDLVVAAGFVNSGANDHILSNSQFKQSGSRFFEIGYAWNTRVFKNTNWLRLKYGISFQFNGFKPNKNRVFMNNTELYGDPYAITLQDLSDVTGSDIEIKKSKLRMDSFIFPIHFEFGSSNKKVNGKYVRYDTNKKFKFGIGGYFGINYNTIQKVKFSNIAQIPLENLQDVFYKGDQATVKGLSAYAGFDDISLYFKYESSTSIRRLVGQHVISLGLRFDL